jgi:hypothetical protein
VKNTPKRRIQKNYALRKELIDKGFIIPVRMVPAWLKARGYLEAAKTANERLVRGLPLYRR